MRHTLKLRLRRHDIRYNAAMRVSRRTLIAGAPAAALMAILSRPAGAAAPTIVVYKDPT